LFSPGLWETLDFAVFPSCQFFACFNDFHRI
jgi:hypothetical protein